MNDTTLADLESKAAKTKAHKGINDTAFERGAASSACGKFHHEARSFTLPDDCRRGSNAAVPSSESNAGTADR